MSVSHKSPPGRTHATTFIIANYYFGPNDVKKQGKVNIRSVTAVECSQLHEEQLKEILRQRELPINNIAASPPAANAPNIMAQQPSQGRNSKRRQGRTLFFGFQNALRKAIQTRFHQIRGFNKRQGKIRKYKASQLTKAPPPSYRCDDRTRHGRTLVVPKSQSADYCEVNQQPSTT